MVIKIAAFIVVPLTLFIIIYTYYGMYKILTIGKCYFCGSKKVKNRFTKAIKFAYTPWRKPRLVCENCSKK